MLDWQVANEQALRRERIAEVYLDHASQQGIHPCLLAVRGAQPVNYTVAVSTGNEHEMGCRWKEATLMMKPLQWSQLRATEGSENFKGVSGRRGEAKENAADYRRGRPNIEPVTIAVEGGILSLAIYLLCKFTGPPAFQEFKQQLLQSEWPLSKQTIHIEVA